MEQIELLENRNQIKKDIIPFKLEKKQITYLRQFFYKNKKSFKKLFWLMAILIVLEIFIPILIKISISRFDYLFSLKALSVTIFTALLILLSYILLSYRVIKDQKIIIINLINDIRRDSFKNILAKSPVTFNKEDKNKLIVKLSYHLSLLQMGLSNSFLSLAQNLFFGAGLLITGLILDFKFFLWALAAIPFNVLVFYFGYVLSVKYLSKDQTLYSKIMHKIIYGLDNFYFIKQNKQ